MWLIQKIEIDWLVLYNFNLESWIMDKLISSRTKAPLTFILQWHLTARCEQNSFTL